MLKGQYNYWKTSYIFKVINSKLKCQSTTKTVLRL